MLTCRQASRDVREIVAQTCPEPRIDNLVAKIVCHFKMADGTQVACGASGVKAMNVNVDAMRAKERAERPRHRRCESATSGGVLGWFGVAKSGCQPTCSSVAALRHRHSPGQETSATASTAVSLKRRSGWHLTEPLERDCPREARNYRGCGTSVRTVAKTSPLRADATDAKRRAIWTRWNEAHRENRFVQRQLAELHGGAEPAAADRADPTFIRNRIQLPNYPTGFGYPITQCNAVHSSRSNRQLPLPGCRSCNWAVPVSRSAVAPDPMVIATFTVPK